MDLHTQDPYCTPPGAPRTLLAQWSPWAELSFFWPVGWIVLRASWRATRGRYGDEEWVEASRGIIQAMEGVGMRLTVEGLSHVRALRGPAVYIANHMSTLETFVLPALLRPWGPLTFVVKASLLTYPVFGPIMRSRDPVAVRRASPREDLRTVLEGGRERLGRGISVVVFPQGERRADFAPDQFNSLGVKLAARAGVPVVPLALSTNAWGTCRWLKDLGPVTPEEPVRFRFGAPLAGDDRGTHEATVSFIGGTLAEWGRG